MNGQDFFSEADFEKILTHLDWRGSEREKCEARYFLKNISSIQDFINILASLGFHGQIKKLRNSEIANYSLPIIKIADLSIITSYTEINPFDGKEKFIVIGKADFKRDLFKAGFKEQIKRFSPLLRESFALAF